MILANWSSAYHLNDIFETTPEEKKRIFQYMETYIQESNDEQILKDQEITFREIDDPDYILDAQRTREELEYGMKLTQWEDEFLASRTEKQKKYISRELCLSYERRKDEGFDSCQRFWNLEFLDEAQK